MKAFLSYFFTFLTFFYTFTSCAPETENPGKKISEFSIESTDTNAVGSKDADYTLMADEYIAGVDILKSHFNDPNNSFPTEIDQASVNYYTVLLGYGTGVLSAEFVNSVIEKMGIINEQGVRAVLEDYDLEEFTLTSLETIATGQPIIDLTSNPDYLLLDQDERELLNMANTITLAEIEPNNPDQGRNCNLGGGIGAVIGGIVGLALCGICALGGALIFGSIGCSLDGGK